MTTRKAGRGAMTERHCKTCPATVSGIRRYCDACKLARREAAWRKQGAERKAMFSEVDQVPYVVGRRPNDEEIDRDLRLVDVAVSRYLAREGRG